MSKRVGLLAIVALVGLGSAPVQAETDCEAARCAVQADLDQCSCSAASNHGRYVSCVAHVVKALSRGDDPPVPTRCKGKIVRCAARSICGKEGFVTCQIPVFGTCDTTTGLCVEDGVTPCTSETDCVIGTKCKIKHSAELCLARGGTVGTSPTCCSDCVTPVP